MGAREERNLERTRHWEWTWNHDVMRMVDECYAEDCEVTDMLRPARSTAVRNCASSSSRGWTPTPRAAWRSRRWWRAATPWRSR